MGTQLSKGKHICESQQAWICVTVGLIVADSANAELRHLLCSSSGGEGEGGGGGGGRPVVCKQSSAQEAPRPSLHCRLIYRIIVHDSGLVHDTGLCMMLSY
jgi:hypothetical protein